MVGCDVVFVKCIINFLIFVYYCFVFVLKLLNKGFCMYFRFSLDGKYLVVGLDDNCVDFYEFCDGWLLICVSYCKGIFLFVI